jgi:hypothetical protein
MTVHAACADCEAPIDSISGVPDPRTAAMLLTAHPCGHPISLQRGLDARVPVTLIPVTGANLVGAERVRQVTDEGYTPEHDEQHTGAELAWAAWCLLDRAASQDPRMVERVPTMWPFEDGSWPAQDKTPMRLLIQAGAYVAAEIDRRLAAGEKP